LTVDVVLSGCAGSATVSVVLNYAGLGAMSAVNVATFIDIIDYGTLEPLSDISSLEVPVHGAGFGSTDLSDYTITFTGTDCGAGAEETYTATTRASDTLLFFAGVDLTSCSSLVYGTSRFFSFFFFHSYVSSKQKNCNPNTKFFRCADIQINVHTFLHCCGNDRSVGCL
jgi:hypothetical protein